MTGDHGDGLSTTALLDDLGRRVQGDSLSLGELTTALGERGPGVMLLLLTLPALIPMPGVPAGMVVGTIIALLSLQMLAGHDHLWLPDWLARRRVGRAVLLATVRAAKPPLARLERRLTPRWHGLTGAHMLRRLSPLVFLMGVLIALPIPFGNIVPALALIAVSLGLLARDGAAVGLGVALGLAATLVCAGLVWAGWRLTNGLA